MAACVEETKPDIDYFQDDPKCWLKEENVKKLYEIDESPGRKMFLDGFFEFRKQKGLYNKMPIIARRPLDLYFLYSVVQKYGGYEQSMKNRMWSQIAREMDLPKSMTSGAFTLKLKYIRLLYEFECFKRNTKADKSILRSANRLEDCKQDTLITELQELRYRSIRQEKLEIRKRRIIADEEEYILFNEYKEMRRKEYEERFSRYKSHEKDRYMKNGHHSPADFENERLPTQNSYTGKRTPNLPLERQSPKLERISSERRCTERQSLSETTEKNYLKTNKNVYDLQLDMMHISKEKITLSLLINNQKFSGELLCYT